MKITIVGLGHVGTVAAACLADAGHDVVGVDRDFQRVEDLGSGRVPFCEPGLREIIEGAKVSERLKFALPWDYAEPLGGVAMVATGTPSGVNGSADLSQVRSAVAWIKGRHSGDTTVVMKSTVPPGTGQKLVGRDLRELRTDYVCNPEFLREGQAVSDWERPDRIVVGLASGAKAPLNAMKDMYGSIDAPWLITDITSAEMVKYASNALLATRISFMNEIAALCEQVGASIDDVGEGVAMDPRTGDRIHAGVGYGGSCFPKDVGALYHLAMTTGVDTEMLRAVITVNNRQRMRPLHAIRDRFGADVSGLRVAVLGLSFKPGTDDVREAPALDLIRALTDDGASVVACDPQANTNARSQLPPPVELADDPIEATDGAQAVVVMTEWCEIIQADWKSIALSMRPPRFLFDGRNALKPDAMKRLGFQYAGVGRPDCGGSPRLVVVNGAQ